MPLLPALPVASGPTGARLALALRQFGARLAVGWRVATLGGEATFSPLEEPLPLQARCFSAKRMPNVIRVSGWPDGHPLLASFR